METQIETAAVPYATVNGQWPAELPELTGPEAIAAFRRLYRFGFKRTFKGQIKLTSGNRYTFGRRGVFYVNPKGHHFGGWRDLVHDLSHYVHRRTSRHKPHHFTHAWLEREMIRHVVESGWLEGKLKPAVAPQKEPPSENEMKAAKLAHVDAAIKRWTTKLRRAQTAIAKLERKRRRLV